MTVLWPLADRPRLAAGIPGGTTPVRLLDDDLAASLAAGGRLDTLLAAADFATSAQVDDDGALGSALCLAVDPDLLITVNAMTGGYVVSDDPNGGLNAPTHPGTGQEAAVNWLARLENAGAAHCASTPDRLRPGRPRCPQTRRRHRPERRRHRRGRRYRRPDSRGAFGARRHPHRRRIR